MAAALNSCVESEISPKPKRLLQDGTEDSAQKKVKTENQAHDQEPMNDGLPRKKKCALLLSYCGTGYAGMQVNPNVKTIEEDLISALHKAGAITDDAKDCIAKMSFQRAARTDKGVSAARQVSLLPVINGHLPPQIRVIGRKKATKSFDAKGYCSGRTYEYLIPTYAFARDYRTTVNYKITKEKLKLVNDILSCFVGTHNFHNFTSGKKFEDPSANRYMISFKCSDPFERNGREFAVVSVRGQSFMLHQIRKMIGLGVAIAREVAPKSTIELAWQKQKVDIPKAPALGLLLDKVHYDRYNEKFGKDGIHDPIEWEELEEEIARFKEEYIYQHIIDTEVKEKAMMKWLRTLQEHTYGYRKMDEIGDKKTPQENNKDQVSEKDKLGKDQMDFPEDETSNNAQDAGTTNECKTEEISVDKETNNTGCCAGNVSQLNMMPTKLINPSVGITNSEQTEHHSSKEKDLDSKENYQT